MVSMNITIVEHEQSDRKTLTITHKQWKHPQVQYGSGVQEEIKTFSALLELKE